MNDIQAQQVVRSGEFDLECSADEAFPLFSPEGERRWVSGWDPQPMFPRSVAFSRDTVFRQGNGDEEAIWTIVDVDPESYRAEYVRVAPASHTAHIVVHVVPIGAMRSHVTVTYAITAFGSNSSSVIEAFSESAYADRMRDWQRRIPACLDSRVPS